MYGRIICTKKVVEMTAGLVYNCTSIPCGNTNFSTANDSRAILEDTEMSIGEILKLTFQVSIAAFGAIGNVLVAVVVDRLGRRKKLADFYIQNLAIADLGTLLFAFPVAAVKEKLPLNWPFGEFACLYLSPVSEVFFGASVWCITVIAIERKRKILAVRKTCQHRMNALQKRTKIVAGCAWMMSFLIFSLPLFFILEYSELGNGGIWCGPAWPSLVFAQAYIVLLTTFSYILPLAVILFTYFTIACALNKSSAFLKSMKDRSIRLKQNKRAKKILTPVVLVFAVTMLPLSVFRLVIVFWPAIAAQEHFENLFYIVSVFVIINSSANPVIYSIVSTDFRKEIKSIGRRRPTERTITSSRRTLFVRNL